LTVGPSQRNVLFLFGEYPVLNPYLIILVLFICGGLGTTLWGWIVIVRGKKTLRWPTVEGVIEVSRQPTDDEHLFPHIVFSYTVSGHRHERDLEFPSGTHPTPAFVTSYINQYPKGAKVLAYYDPAQPGHATLEPGPARDDWFIFSLGIVVTVLGIGFLIFGG